MIHDLHDTPEYVSCVESTRERANSKYRYALFMMGMWDCVGSDGGTVSIVDGVDQLSREK